MRYTKTPKIDRKSKLQNGYRYIFFRYNPSKQRNEVVPKDQIPPHIFNSQDENLIREYVSSQSAIEDAIRHRIHQRMEWETNYHDFKNLLELFTEEHKKRAPNSWKTDSHYLERYAFHFFLSVAKINNLNLWWTQFRQFKAWLETVPPLKIQKSHLEKNTQNKIIKALNRFLDLMSQNGKCEETRRCPFIPKSELRRSDASTVIDESEIKRIIEELKIKRPLSADLFLVLVRTGMRLNESLGLCMPFIFPGEIDGKNSRKIHEKLHAHQLSRYHGFICLESQPKNEGVHKIRSVGGEVIRKPLKSRKEISGRWFRYIPIWDKEAWNTIVKLWNQTRTDYENKKWGKEGKNYLLFDGLSASMFYQDLVSACARANVKPHSPHDARHTFCTWFYGIIGGDEFLAEAVVGHRDKEIRENYNHLSEQIGNEMKSREMRSKLMSFVE